MTQSLRGTAKSKSVAYSRDRGACPSGLWGRSIRQAMLFREVGEPDEFVKVRTRLFRSKVCRKQFVQLGSAVGHALSASHLNRWWGCAAGSFTVGVVGRVRGTTRRRARRTATEPPRPPDAPRQYHAVTDPVVQPCRSIQHRTEVVHPTQLGFTDRQPHPNRQLQLPLRRDHGSTGRPCLTHSRAGDRSGQRGRRHVHHPGLRDQKSNFSRSSRSTPSP